jgi:hypothetical protein
MYDILRYLVAVDWGFGDSDPAALAEIKRRISVRARTSRPQQNYSELVSGIVFRLPTVNSGDPYEIDVHDWQSLDRQILGKFLGRVNTDSYRAGRFFASAIAVQADTGTPSEPFYELALESGFLRDDKEDDRLEFWSAQTRAAVTWFCANPDEAW